jgi:lysophospholipase L1-like esterase
MKTVTLLLATSLLFVARLGLAAEDARPIEDAAKFKLQTPKNAALPTIWLVGDSTVRVGTPGQRGWGDELGSFFDPNKVNVVNHAIGGRSSRTFQTEGRWANSLALMRKGDFVLIQFGHNDPGPTNDNSRARGTIRGVGEETEEIDNLLTHQREVVHSFGWYLRKYVREAKAKGVTPVVCSPVPRKSWKDNKINRAAGSYGGWAAQVAKQEGGAFVDLNEIIARGYEQMGQEAVNPLFADSGTHTTVAGAQFNAQCVVAGLKALPLHPLDNYLSPAGRGVKPFVP